MSACVKITRDRVREAPLTVSVRPNYEPIVTDVTGRVRSDDRTKTRQEAMVRLGDRIKNALAEHGVTEESWVALKEEIGLPATCACDARRKWLNALDEKLGLGEKLAAVKRVIW